MKPAITGCWQGQSLLGTPGGSTRPPPHLAHVVLAHGRDRGGTPAPGSKCTGCLLHFAPAVSEDGRAGVWVRQELGSPGEEAQQASSCPARPRPQVT